ncbi:hypothetical protein Vretimale_7597 [Volvox reticuliferus]|uniref:Copper transport protein n=1 Tax=Volvox reticuliferus TaxID=1737510 RepID=A0A8J4C9M0_9CHLO|nr:hypothetical protein Vretifemale_7630 [Volvox reticuliferus]GIM02753.1 hypothetical protein Vretimale_7597 [Volvox reticuliferus]
MLGQGANLVIFSIVAILLCSTPILRGTAPPTSMSMHSSMHSHDHEHGESSSDLHQHTMPMAMFFEYGSKTTLWFSSLRTDTPASYIAALLGLGLLAFVHEGLTAYRSARSSYPLHSIDQLDLLREPKLAVAAGASFNSTERLVQAGLHVASMGLSYMLMLAVMSMNFGVFVAVLLGFGVGFYMYHGERLFLSPPLVRGDACHGR